MKRLKTTTIIEYKYDTEEERSKHIIDMQELGYECDGQFKRSDDNLMKENREYYWIGRFYKYE